MGIKNTSTNPTNPYIHIIGSLNIDFVTTTPRCPGPGETLTAHSLSITSGGKGANQAVACGRASSLTKGTQDVAVSMVGAVGAHDAYYAALLRPALEASGVDTGSIGELAEAQTGSASIIVEDGVGGENRILVVPGANHAGLMADAGRIVAVIEQQQQQQGICPGVVVMQGEIPRETTMRLLEYFNGTEQCVVFNPAPVFPEGVSLAPLRYTPVLIMNETEAVQMARCIADDRPGSDLSQATPTELDCFRPDELAPRFHEMALVQIVLITLGSNGVYFSTRTGRRGFVRGIKVVKVLDTTAAGDTFVGYFSTALARFLAGGKSLEAFDDEIESAVRTANGAAARCVQRRGAAQSIPFAYEME